MSVKRPAVTIPAPFLAVPQQSSGTRRMDLIPNATSIFNPDGSIPENVLAVFGQLLGPSVAGLTGGPSVSPLDRDRYLQSISLDQPYQNVVVPLFGQIVTYALEDKNGFLTEVICPPWNTPQKHFTASRKEFNHVRFTNIGEHGIPDEQTHFTYSWSDDVDRSGLRDRIDRDLALDPNFGARAWLDSLTALSTNAQITFQLGIIFGGLHCGYMNMTMDRVLGRFSHHKLHERVANEFGLFALDAARGFAAIRNYENQIPGLDSVIGPAGFMQSLRDLEGESKTVPAQKLWTNPEDQKLMMTIYDGPDSSKTINLGNRKLNFYELEPFRPNTRSRTRYQPLTRRETFGEFHPPFPERCAADDNRSLDPNQHDIFIFSQSKNSGEEVRISHSQRITGAFYYKSMKKGGRGDPRTEINRFAEYLNDKHEYATSPWTWNPANPNMDKEALIKNDAGDYDDPDMKVVAGKHKVKEMPYRELTWGIGFNPARARTGRPYYVPIDIVNFMPSQMNGDWIFAAVRKVAQAQEKKLGVSNISELFSSINAVVEILNDADWNDAWVEGYINKNLPKVLEEVGSWKIVAQMTPASKLKKFPGANPVEEFKTNSRGALDLPDRGGSIVGAIPPGMANAVGIIELSYHADDPSSLYKEIGAKCKHVTRIFEEALTVVQQTIGKTKPTDPEYSYPWSAPTALATFMDAFIQPGAPLFLGVPRQGDSYKGGSGGSSSIGNKPAESKQNLELWNQILNTDKFPDPDPVKNPEQVRIDNVVKALASINAIAGAKFVEMDILDKGKDLYRDNLCTLVIAVSGYTQTTVSAIRIVNASLIVNEVSKRVTKGDSAESIAAFIKTYSDANKTMMNKLLLEIEDINVSTDANTVRMSRLKEYEKKLIISGKVGQDLPVRNAEEQKEDEEKIRASLKPESYKGNFSDYPLKYLRTPLTDSPKLREYLSRKKVRYVLPGDEKTFYELPVASGSIKESDFIPKSTKMKSDITTFVGFRSLQSKLSANSERGSSPSSSSFSNKSKLMDMEVESMDASDDEDGIFRSLKSKRNEYASSKSSFVSNFLSGFSGLGKDFGSNDFVKKTRERDYSNVGRSAKVDDVTEDSFSDSAIEYHIDYMNRFISSDAHRFIYQLIIEAPNTIEIHHKLSTIGARIAEVMTIRPFIQATMHPLLLCKAGPETWIYAYGHSTVQVTKELRGIFHINCEVEHGLVKTNPDNVAMMPSSLFHSFDGGKNCIYMSDVDDYARPNPHKASMIGFMIPMTENRFKAPLHARNEEFYTNINDDYALWDNKCSAFGDFFDFIFMKHNPKKSDIQETNRVTFNAPNNVSHLLQLGATAYIDPVTGNKVDRHGTGPGGDRRMNQPGAQLTWNGQSFRFGDYSQYLLTTLSK